MANKYNGSTLFDIAFPLVDYRGDIRNGRKSNYTKDFSPNNIRRLIFSPTEVAVEYNTKVDGKYWKKVQINSGLYTHISMMPDYKPIIRVISDENICASIEEIVIISTGSDGTILNSNELALESLIKSYKGDGDIQSKVSGRYKRLRDFCIINNYINCGILIKYLSTNEIDFVADIKDVNPDVTWIHKDDWYDSLNTLHAQSYYLDITNGTLSTIFKNRQIKYKNNIKADEVNKLKNSRLKEYIKKQDKALTTYSCIYRAYSTLNYFLVKSPSSILSQYDFGVSKLGLNKVDNLPESKYYSIFKSDKNDKDAIIENIDKLNSKSSEIYNSIVTLLLDSLVKLGNLYPSTLKTIMNGDINTTIKIPSSLTTQNNTILEMTGKNFSGENINNSLINACLLFTQLFISDNTVDSKVKKYQAREAWLERVRG